MQTAILDNRWRYLKVDLTLFKLTDKLQSIDSLISTTQKHLNLNSSKEMIEYQKHESVPELQQCLNLFDIIPELIVITTNQGDILQVFYLPGSPCVKYYIQIFKKAVRLQQILITNKTRHGLQYQPPFRSYPLLLDPYPLSFFPTPCSLSSSTDPLNEFR